jgi:hypothetical protein
MNGFPRGSSLGVKPAGKKKDEGVPAGLKTEDPSALMGMGGRDGAQKFIKEAGGIFVYVWSGATCAPTAFLCTLPAWLITLSMCWCVCRLPRVLSMYVYDTCTIRVHQ